MRACEGENDLMNDWYEIYVRNEMCYEIIILEILLIIDICYE